MKLVKRLEKQGFGVERTGSGHWKVTAPDGGMTVIGFSPSSRGLKESVKRLKDLGFEP